MNSKLRIALCLGSLVMGCSSSSFQGDPVPSEPLPVEEPTADLKVEIRLPEPVVENINVQADRYELIFKVDLVFAIDTSASMNDELLATQTHLPKMIKILDNGRLDARIHLLLDQTLTLPADIDAQKVAFVRQRVDSADAISRLNNLFLGNYAANYRNLAGAAMAEPLAFRNDARREVVVITDDNGSGTGNLAADFNASFKATLNGVVGLPDSVETDTCEVQNIGQEYITLAKQLGGSLLDICNPDWSVLITQLSNAIVKRSSSFVLSKSPTDPKALLVKLDGKELPADAWSYDDKTKTMTLLKTDAVKTGSVLIVEYTPLS